MVSTSFCIELLLKDPRFTASDEDLKTGLQRLKEGLAELK